MCWDRVIESEQQHENRVPQAQPARAATRSPSTRRPDDLPEAAVQTHPQDAVAIPA